MTVRGLEINNRPILGRIIVCLQRCNNRRIAGYVTVTTPLKADKKTSKFGRLFVSSSLRTGQVGFTLIEVLIGMSILSIMMLLLFATLRTCVQSWNLGEKKIAEVSQAGIIQNFFQSKLHSTLPLKANFLKEDNDEEDRQRFSFEGNENQLQFVSAMPASAGRLGLQLFTMSLQQAEKGDGSDLLVDIKPFFPKSEDEEWQNEEVVILKNISDLRFAYFGLDEEAEVAQDEEESLSWQDEWLERQVLPKLVSIDIELSNGKIWPQIVVALKVNTTDANGGGRQSPFGAQRGNPFGAR